MILVRSKLRKCWHSFLKPSPRLKAAERWSTNTSSVCLDAMRRALQFQMSLVYALRHYLFVWIVKHHVYGQVRLKNWSARVYQFSCLCKTVAFQRWTTFIHERLGICLQGFTLSWTNAQTHVRHWVVSFYSKTIH